MHLTKLALTNFRSFESGTLHFHENLTVLVGENNGGKSNIIDALRLATVPLSERRDRYAELDDVRRGAMPAAFKIEAGYAGLSDTLKGLLVTGVPDPSKDEAIFGCKYEAVAPGFPRGKFSRWAGKFERSEPEQGSTDLIRHVYLPALRDAYQTLGSGSAGRVMSLLRHFVPEADRDEFLEATRRPAGASPQSLTDMRGAITTALSTLTEGVRPQVATVDFAEDSLNDLARDLRFKLADHGLPPHDIRSSGLGYSNLLYMATVVVELAKAKEADLTLFLVEEPEAHLHPQLQSLVLDFLREKAEESANAVPASGMPEGRLQVIVSTHSPNLTAWVSPKHLVVVRSSSNGPGTSAQSGAIAIGHLSLERREIEKIERYLDVTRSALLFGNRALLVEGIAEAILIPVIARHHVLKSEAKAWSRFKGATLVSIDGVDFRPYVQILLEQQAGVRIADKVTVVTDRDPTVKGNRKEDLEHLAKSLGSGPALTVLTNDRTLEHSLFAANAQLMIEAVLELHPRSSADFTTSMTADAFVDTLDRKKTRKGDLAQTVAHRIENGCVFVVPGYLQDAIKAISAA